MKEMPVFLDLVNPQSHTENISGRNEQNGQSFGM